MLGHPRRAIDTEEGTRSHHAGASDMTVRRVQSCGQLAPGHFSVGVQQDTPTVGDRIDDGHASPGLGVGARVDEGGQSARVRVVHLDT